MNIQNSNFTSIEQMTGQLLKNKQAKEGKATQQSTTSFQNILQTKQVQLQTKAESAQNNISELKFSKHANERLASRNIDLTKEQLNRLEGATTKAREKGINESLVMVDNLAFIVSVKNNTVITAVNDGEDKIFTNIDGAIIN